MLQDYGLYIITNSFNETDLLQQLTLILDRIVLSYSVLFPKFRTLCIKFPNLFVKMPQVTIPLANQNDRTNKIVQTSFSNIKKDITQQSHFVKLRKFKMIDFLFQPETMRAITPDFNALSYQVSGQVSSTQTVQSILFYNQKVLIILVF